MSNKHQPQGHHCHKGGKLPSSYWMHNNDIVFDKIDIKQGNTIIDLGTGTGEYALRASRLTGETGTVYALDKWEEMVEKLREKAGSQGIKNIKPILCDITEKLPLKDNCGDISILATVLHGVNSPEKSISIYREVNRILKPGGRLFIIECKKEETPFGPPLHKRLSPDDIESVITKFGFKKNSCVDLENNYMLEYEAIK